MSAEQGRTHVPPVELSGRLRHLVEAALRILQTEGPAAVTMRRVAAGLGIEAPTLYRHISDKGVIEGLLQHHAMAEFGRSVGAAPPHARSVAGPPAVEGRRARPADGTDRGGAGR